MTLPSRPTRARGLKPDIDNPEPTCAQLVSIHAPAWGATGSIKGVIIELPSFNPRARVGRDLKVLVKIGIVDSFNPRARVGRD